jgi:hypothetical protein
LSKPLADSTASSSTCVSSNNKAVVGDKLEEVRAWLERLMPSKGWTAETRAE